MNVSESQKWLRETRLRLGLTTTEVANQARDLARADGHEMVLAQQSVSGFELGNGKRMPAWFKYAKMALERADGVPDLDQSPQVVRLDVSLPSEAALKRMFETMLEKDLPEGQRDALARSLARRLPAGLARASVSPPVPVRGEAIDHEEDIPLSSTRHKPHQQERRT